MLKLTTSTYFYTLFVPFKDKTSLSLLSALSTTVTGRSFLVQSHSQAYLEANADTTSIYFPQI